MKETFKEGIIYKHKFIEVGASFYWNTTENFWRGGLNGLARSLKCDDSLAVCVEEETETYSDGIYQVGNLSIPRKNVDNPQEGRVYDPRGCCPTIIVSHIPMIII